MDQLEDRSGVVALGVGAGSGGDTAGLFHTSEVRWFARGSIPSDVQAWFTGGRTVGSVEERLDTYQLHGLDDIGVKRRYGTTLEVKVRRTLGSSLSLGGGLDGRVEEWSRWEPGEGDGIWQLSGTPWVDVRKVIFTRSFMPADREVILPSIHTNRLFAGCDIEIAEVSVGGVDTWSLALEAFGPTTGRQHALVSSWRTLLAHTPWVEDLGFVFDRACGYPEWLRFVTLGQLEADR